MIKQVFGSFFRTIGRIIAYLAFGALLALIFQNKDVFAAEASYYSAYFKPYTYENIGNATMDQDISLNADEFIEYSEWISVDSSYSNSSSWFGGISFRVFGGSSNTYLADNTYTFRFTLDFYNSTAAQRFKDNFICNSINGNSASSSTGATAEQIDNYSCKIEQGSESNRMLLYLYVKPANDLKYIRVYLRPKQLIPLSNADLSVSTIQLPYRYLELTYVKITYTEGTIAYIENQTATIINQTDKINDSIDKFINIFKDNAEKQEDIYLNDTENSDGTCGGILCNLKKVVKGVINFPQTILTAIIDGLKALFIPPDFTFLDDFRNSIESKLGFIAEVPMAIIDFTLNLATASWDEFDSISFPEIEIFGYKFWNSQEIDLTEAINIFKPFKYITDCLCVIICARTLNKWREKFTGGGD